MAHEELDSLLRELKEEHARMLPPPFISTRLQVEAAEWALRRKRRSWMMFLFPAFSLTLLALAFLRWQSDPNRPRTVDLLSASYIQLPSSATLPEPNETTVVRVVLRKERLRQFGFVVAEGHSSDLTRVDFVLGEDGLARSVRFAGPMDGISLQRSSRTGPDS
jgi:hypothetical protein